MIVIIGILAAALIPRLQSVQSRARDTKRKADISQIHNALRIFHTDKGVYPVPVNSSYRTGAYNWYHYVYSTQGINWIATLTWIVTSLPVDPINIGTASWANTWDYFYYYGNNRKSGKAFWMAAKLENKNDPDRCAIQQYSWYHSNFVMTCANPAQCSDLFCWMLYGKSDIGP